MGALRHISKPPCLRPVSPSFMRPLPAAPPPAHPTPPLRPQVFESLIRNKEIMILPIAEAREQVGT
jgi:hypothetical protein